MGNLHKIIRCDDIRSAISHHLLTTKLKALYCTIYRSKIRVLFNKGEGEGGTFMYAIVAVSYSTLR